MTNEAKERAIRWLTEEVRLLRLAPKVNGCEPDNWAEQLKVMETCLEAVRDHFPDTKKMMPLTLEQLREMDGHPVWVEFEDRSGGLWGIVHISVFEQIAFPDGLHCTIGQPYYGKIYKAYACPPSHLDMEAWSGCVCTTSDKSCCTCVSMNCHTCIRQSEYKMGRYCSACGRPMTEGARAELEKRLRG